MLPRTKHKRKQHNIQGQEQKAPPPWVYTTVYPAERWGWAGNVYLMSNEHVHFHVASPFCKGCQLVMLTAMKCEVWSGHMLLQSSTEAWDLELYATTFLTLSYKILVQIPSSNRLDKSEHQFHCTPCCPHQVFQNEHQAHTRAVQRSM